MTIKTTGTGDDVRVLANAGEDEIQRVSCLCCGCEILPTTSVSLVISGALFCDDIFAPPPAPPNGSFSLPYVPPPAFDPLLKRYLLITEDYTINVSCSSGVLDVNITSTGEGIFFVAPIELKNGGSGNNTLVCGVSGAGNGGTATISWE